MRGATSNGRPYRDPQNVRDYLAQAAKTLLAEPRFLDVLSGFVLDSDRVPLIEEQLTSIAAGAR